MTRYTAHFQGRVQGVGFRYTAVQVARGFPVAGYVQNLSDGRVRLVAEGDPADLKEFLQTLEQAMVGYITAHTLDQSPANGEFGQPSPGGLRVRH
ncbi:MAG: acylphosphatase [Phycisphaeraceae bacterium]|nr:acylphosphatase [Phycisphaeraceae bacterium]